MNLFLGKSGSVHGTSLFSIDGSGLDILQVLPASPEEFCGVVSADVAGIGPSCSQSTFGRKLKISVDVSSPCQNSAAIEVGIFPTCLPCSQNRLVGVAAGHRKMTF